MTTETIVQSDSREDPLGDLAAGLGPGLDEQPDAGLGEDVADAPETTLAEALHLLLARLAGQVPDGLLSQGRRWLADWEPVSLARSVASCAASLRLPMAAPDLALLRGLLHTAGTDGSVLDGVPLADGEPLLRHVFAAAAPEVIDRRGEELGLCLDLTPGGLTDRAELSDDLDRAAVAAAETDGAAHGVIALWRTWRSPAGGEPWPGPRRVFLLAVEADAAPHLAAAWLQGELARQGEPDPQVEAFSLQSDLPRYQNTARAFSALLWTAEPTPPIRLARVYDLVDPRTGPAFAPDRAQLTDAEREEVALLLETAPTLLTTTTALDDVLEPSEDGYGVVPVDFRSDGQWVWSDAITYYALVHGVAPVADLLDHLRAGPVGSDPGEVAVFRAMAALTAPEGSEQVTGD
jgi:hypothetical protein